MKILVLNGPNLNLLKQRDANHYGNLGLDDIQKILETEFSDDEFQFFQSNQEGELIDKIQSASENFDALIINPGGYAHSSVAIRDALEMANIIKIETHLSNLSSRESFRQNLITASACDGYISGFQEKSYLAAVYLAKKIFRSKR